MLWMSTNKTTGNGGEEMEKENLLLGTALGRFRSVAKLAEALGWSYSKTNRIVRGMREPTSSEIRALAQVMELSDAESITSIFSLR